MRRQWLTATRLGLTLIGALLLLALPQVAMAGPDPQASPEQRLRVPMGEPMGLDPGVISDGESQSVLALVFEGLLKLDKDGKLVAAVAKEMPSAANGGVSADGKTYTFKLRTDVKYADGKPVRAQDFEFALKRVLEPGLQPTYAQFYYNIIGAEEFNTSEESDPAKLAALRQGVGVFARDDYTLEILLKEAQPTLPYLVALAAAYPLREDVVGASQGSDNPDAWARDSKNVIGNGPFQVAEWVEGDHMILVPNEQYFGARPKLQEITLLFAGDEESDYDGYLQGDLDIVAPPMDRTAEVLNDQALSSQIARFTRASTTIVAFNHARSPFDNPAVRRAFSMATNREAYIQQVNGGIGKPAYSWIPPNLPGYQPDLGLQWGLDPAKAKETLASAGYPEGQSFPGVTLLITKWDQDAAEALRAQWRENLGVEVQVAVVEPKDFDGAIAEGNFDMMFMNWTADYPDPENWLPTFATGNGFNAGGYSNPDLDQLVKAAAVEPGATKRAEMWAEAQQKIVDDAAALFLFHPERFRLVNPNLKGIVLSPLDASLPGFRSYGQVWVEKQ